MRAPIERRGIFHDRFKIQRRICRTGWAHRYPLLHADGPDYCDIGNRHFPPHKLVCNRYNKYISSADVVAGRVLAICQCPTAPSKSAIPWNFLQRGSRASGMTIGDPCGTFDFQPPFWCWCYVRSAPVSAVCRLVRVRIMTPRQ